MIRKALDTARRLECAATSGPVHRDGWAARLDLGLERRPGRTVLARRARFGPLAVQRTFYPEGELCHLYLLHPPGGLVGGDRLTIAVAADPGAAALVTTPGATKCWRSAGPQAHQSQSLAVGSGASLEWLPQETILFRGAECTFRTRIDLAHGARYMGWELYCLGRPAIGERFDKGRADLGLALYREGRPLLHERLRIEGPADLDGPPGLRGLAATGTLLATPADSDLLGLVRERLAERSGVLAVATLLDEVLAVRVLADSTQGVRALLESVWTAARPAVLGRPACPPRIWAT